MIRILHVVFVLCHCAFVAESWLVTKFLRVTQILFVANISLGAKFKFVTQFSFLTNFVCGRPRACDKFAFVPIFSLVRKLPFVTHFRSRHRRTKRKRKRTRERNKKKYWRSRFVIFKSVSGFEPNDHLMNPREMVEIVAVN